MELSPDGSHIALTYEEGSEVRLAVMNIEDREIETFFEFGENQHVLNYWWASEERIVMAVGEVTGNLDNRGRPSYWYAADRDGSYRTQIYDAQGSGYQVLDPLPEDDRHMLIARYHWADEGVPKGNLIDIYDGELDFVGDQPVDDDMVGLIADNNGEIRAAAALKMGETLADRELRIYVKHGEDWRTLDVESERASPEINFLGFSKDNSKAYLSSNHDMAENDRNGVFRYDFDTERLELIHRDPDVDVGGLLYGTSGEVLGAHSSLGPMRYTLFDESVEKHREEAGTLQSLIVTFPDSDVRVVSTSRDGKLAIVYVSSDRNPGDYYLFDTESKQLEFLNAALPELPKEQLVEMKPVRIEARDGLELHAFLTLPEDKQEDVPLVLNVHGGPFGPYDAWGFNREAQFLAHHGYATLQVNFRGSGGRGADFERAGWKEWGGKMQNDVTDATRWAIEQGIADEDRICIYGGSYGGYAALMGVVKEPDLYECAIGYVGVYDLPWFRSGDGNDFSSQRSSGRDGREAFERFMSTAVGDDMEQLRRNSPVHNVDKIKADLLLVHGGSDVRVVIGHMERLRTALDEIGKDYEWMVKEEEGHGFYDVDNRVDFYSKMLEFLDRNIGPEAETSEAMAEAAE
ncbi:MAG: prolyl oligopeptidase family serine peptidase [Gammaproteobacteria bacterium]|nr:prolyl oligopeptidase family serine peptidase [Gammaproteobacteria bacterium]